MQMLTTCESLGADFFFGILPSDGIAQPVELLEDVLLPSFDKLKSKTLHLSHTSPNSFTGIRRFRFIHFLDKICRGEIPKNPYNNLDFLQLNYFTHAMLVDARAIHPTSRRWHRIARIPAHSCWQTAKTSMWSKQNMPLLKASPQSASSQVFVSGLQH